MSKIFLYNLAILPRLPKNFVLPESYINLMKRNDFIDIEPWSFLYDDMNDFLNYYSSMLSEYKDHPLIPFAIANDQSGLFNDGYIILACFDGNDNTGNPKVYFHDYGYHGELPSWDKRYYLDNFLVWLEVAKGEAAQYKAERDEAD